MDKGRREHVSIALSSLKELRLLKLQRIDETGAVESLCGDLSRMGEELRVAATFRKEQLRSLVVPCVNRFVLWLTLQNEGYFRGGRAVSERLSAARIGERMLTNGNDRASPSMGMWPLLCNEINLSYDQEERVRGFQRQLLQNPRSWVDVRYATKASNEILENIDKCMRGISEMTRQRERKILSVLSKEQKSKFLVWAGRRQEAIKKHVPGDRFAQRPRADTPPALEALQISNPLDSDDKAAEHSSETKPKTSLGTSPAYQIATNVIIIDNNLKSILQTLPKTPVLASGNSLKRLSRRPSFESLASAPLKEMARENSSSSLKRSSSDLCGEVDEARANNAPPISNIIPAQAQMAAIEVTTELLKPAGVTPLTCRPLKVQCKTQAGTMAPTPVTSTNANLNVNTNVNQDMNTNASQDMDTNVSQHMNTNSGQHMNTNAGQHMITNASQHMNTNAGQRMNTNVSQHMNISASHGMNTNMNQQLNTNTNQYMNMNISQQLNTNDNQYMNTNINQLMNTNMYQNMVSIQHPGEDIPNLPPPMYFNTDPHPISTHDVVMNVVPEDREYFVPPGTQATEEFLLDLAEEGDWAIGGFDAFD